MTTEEWVDLACQQCQAALSEPGIEQVKELLDRAGSSESMQCDALQSSASAQRPSPAMLMLRQSLAGTDSLANRFPLERKLLLDQALRSLPHIASLPVDETVKQLFCKEFLLIAQPTDEALPRFTMDGYIFVAMARVAMLRRFPAGHYHWEISGFPRSWFPKIPLRLLPATLRFLLAEAKGLKPWFVSHMRGTGSGTPFLIESEFQKSFFRMALALEKQPHIKAVSAQSWLHSPETHRVSPHLAFLNRIFTEAGGIITDLGQAPAEDGFAFGNKQRAELFRLGQYKPTVGVAACSRRQAMSWAEKHPEIEKLLTVK